MSNQRYSSQRSCKPSVDTGRAVLFWLLSGLLSPALTAAWAAHDAASRYSQNMLLNPSESVRRAEARGRVTIYDGVDDSVVERALDTQFERIDNMMFIRTRHPAQDGSVEEDDGCD
jgi:hypothetical protein